MTPHGEGGLDSAIAAAQEIFALKGRLLSYPASNIYNVDEASLLFKLIPCRTYVFVTEGRKSVMGTKCMKSNDRLTAFVCTNADGSDRVEFPLIGKFKNPRCFRLGLPAV